MTERKPPSPLKDLDARLRQARGQRQSTTGRGGPSKAPMQGLSLAFRIGTELVAALVVGVGIGLLIDRWLQTGPWALIVFFFVGAAAGLLNVYRSVAGYGLAAGYRGSETRPETGPEAEVKRKTEKDGEDGEDGEEGEDGLPPPGIF